MIPNATVCYCYAPRKFSSDQPEKKIIHRISKTLTTLEKSRREKRIKDLEKTFKLAENNSSSNNQHDSLFTKDFMRPGTTIYFEQDGLVIHSGEGIERIHTLFENLFQNQRDFRVACEVCISQTVANSLEIPSAFFNSEGKPIKIESDRIWYDNSANGNHFWKVNVDQKESKIQTVQLSLNINFALNLVKKNRQIGWLNCQAKLILKRKEGRVQIGTFESTFQSIEC